MDTNFDLKSSGGVDAYMAKCGSRTVLTLLADKWVLLVLCALTPGPMRFSALLRRIDGITHKMLAQTLKNLERDGLLFRTVHPTTPPQVVYELTELGGSVTGLVDQIRGWAESNVEQIFSARATFNNEAEATGSNALA